MCIKRKSGANQVVTKFMRIAGLMFFLSPFYLFFSNAIACDWLPDPSAVSAKNTSTLIFSGDVLSKEVMAIPQLGEGYKEYLVKFRVRRYWKGKPSRELVIRTPIGKENCGYDFESGKSYLVYAVDTKPPLVTFCSRSSLLSEPQAQEDMIRLGPGVKSQVETSTTK